MVQRLVFLGFPFCLSLSFPFFRVPSPFLFFPGTLGCFGPRWTTFPTKINGALCPFLFALVTYLDDES
jgi:hypothetical protein